LNHHSDFEKKKYSVIIFMKTAFPVPTVQQFYILLIYIILKVKKVLERVGTCWTLLDCWTVGTVFCLWQKPKFFFFFDEK